MPAIVRFLSVLSLFSLQFVGSPGPAALAQFSDACEEPLPSVEPVPICGTTTISGSSSGYTLIQVPPGGAELHDAKIHIEGTGDFVGFILTQERPYLAAPDCGTRDGLAIPLCPNDPVLIRGLVSESFVAPSRFVATGSDPDQCAPLCSLGEGTYRLYLLADGGPVKITVEFQGIDGSVDLAPLHPVYYEARQPETVHPPNGPVFAAGFTGTLPTPGLQFAIEGARTTAHVAGDIGNCYYLEDPGDPRLAYQPTCPGWLTGGAETLWSQFTILVPGINQSWLGVGFAYPFRAGDAGIGGYSAFAGVPERASVAAFQLALDSD